MHFAQFAVTLSRTGGKVIPGYEKGDEACFLGVTASGEVAYFPAENEVRDHISARLKDISAALNGG